MEWDYAQLSKLAKENGGPEALVNKIFSDGVYQGKLSMIIWIFLSPLLCMSLHKLYVYIKKKWRSSQDIQNAKDELVQGIKEYDENHPEIIPAP